MKVHAQRKFAQGSIISNNVSPYKEDQFIPSFVIPKLQNISSKNSANTDDFLNFLCFRGTSLLPPKLAHFNTSSTTDEDIHPENLKGSNSKNGPIITSMCKNIGEIADSFIAFGVRKRADPIITSRQMDRKRKHALALQDLRRKYQEQKMAKIRAITISKLSEKTSNRILDVKLKPNCIPKNDVPKKMANKNPSKVSSTHLEVPKINIKSLVPKIDSKMCLRSCRTSFVQQELLSVRIKPCKKSIQRDGTKRLKNLQQKVISTKCEVRKYSLRRCHAVRNCERITRSNSLRKASNKTRPSIKFKSAFTKQRILRSNAFKDQKLLQNKHESNLVNVNSTATSTVNDIKDTLKDSQSVPIVRPDILNKKILTKETQKNFSNKSKIKMIVERPNLKTKPLKKLKKNFQITNKSIKPEECETEVLKKQDIPFKRPSRKTKEAATIYMEILSQKLVNEYRIDGEDDISIDSFPELPNVKKTTQRENELKAKVINNKKVSPQIGESRPKNKLFKVKNQIKRKSASGKNILIKKKITESFSDSDEEPLSKLTNKNKNEEQESKIVKTKPKRECAKLPQNYLLMSSSSDEDIFSDRYIYAESPKPTKQKQKTANVKLLSKEILMSPKTRVNMSKEQIEKWLTESLTPEKVPYKEDSSCNSFCDYNYELKKVLEDSKGEITNKKNNDDTDVCSKSEGKKPILRKTKNTKECSVGAFSAFNESSVYAFGEENETKISTPFRHTPRRSSIGNTSKSDNGDSSRAKKNI